MEKLAVMSRHRPTAHFHASEQPLADVKTLTLDRGIEHLSAGQARTATERERAELIPGEIRFRMVRHNILGTMVRETVKFPSSPVSATVFDT